MNEHEPYDELDSSNAAVERLRVLKQIGPSDSSKRILRSRVAEQVNLERSSTLAMSVEPWYRKRIAIPIPLALAASVIWFMPLAWFILQPSDQDRSSEFVVVPPSVTEQLPNLLTSTEDASHASENAFSYSFRATYLSGVGQIQSTNIYSFKE